MFQIVINSTGPGVLGYFQIPSSVSPWRSCKFSPLFLEHSHRLLPSVDRSYLFSNIISSRKSSARLGKDSHVIPRAPCVYCTSMCLLYMCLLYSPPAYWITIQLLSPVYQTIHREYSLFISSSLVIVYKYSDA